MNIKLTELWYMEYEYTFNHFNYSSIDYILMSKDASPEQVVNVISEQKKQNNSTIISISKVERMGRVIFGE